MGLPASLWVVDEEEKHLRIAAAVGVRPSYTEEAILPLDEPSVAGDCFSHEQPQAILSIADNARWKYKDEAEEMGWKSYLSVPVRIGEEVIGVLGVYTFVERSFTPFEQQLLTNYANQAGVRVESERMRKVFQKLLDIAHKLDRLTAEDPQAVLGQVVQDAREITGADCVVLYPYDLAREDFYETEKVAASGLRVKPLKLSNKPRKTGGMAAYVRREKEVVIESIQEEDPAMLESPFINREGVRAFMGVALEVADGTVGILYIDYRTPHEFPDEEKNVIRLFARQVAIAVHNAWLFEQTSRRAEVFENLDRIARDITSIRDRDELLRQTLEHSLEILDAEFGSISVFDPAEGLLQFKYARGKPEDKSVALGEGLIGTAAAEEETVRVADVSKGDRYVTHVKETRSELDVPMMVGNRLVGVLNAESSRLEAFSEEDVQLAEALAAQAAMAFYKADLIEQHQVLTNFGRKITSGIRLAEQEILNLIHEQASDLMDTDNMYVALYEPDPGQPDQYDPENPEQSKIHGTVRFPLAFKEGKPINLETRKAGRGRTEWIIQHREPIFISTEKEAKAWYDQPGHHEYIGEDIWNSWLGVPMMVGEKVLGMIATYHPERDYVYSEDDLDILQAMGNQAAIALDNAELHYDVNKRLDSLVEVARMMTSGVRQSEKDILDTIRSQAGELMDVKNMYIALYDDMTDTVRFPLAFKDGEPLDVETRKAGKGRTEWIIRHQEPIFISTEEEAKAWYGKPGREEYIRDPLASWLGVPMIVGEKVLGVIATYHPERDYVYSGDDLDILRAMANQSAVALDNVRGFDRLETLVEFVEGITSGARMREQQILGEEQILELIYNEISELMDTSNMGIALYDEATDIIRFGLVMREGKRIDVEEEAGWKPRPGLTGRGKTNEIIRNKSPILLSTQKEEEEWYAEKEDRGRYLAEPRASYLGVPMMVGDRVLGVIDLYHPKNEFEYDGSDLRILQSLAAQAAIALDNAASYARAETRRRHLEAVRDVTNEIVTELDPQVCMERILDRTMQLLDAHYATIQLVDETANELVIRAQRGVEGKKLDPKLYRIEIGAGVTGVAAEEERTVRVGNVGDAPYYLDYVEGTQSEMATPLIEHGKVIGVLNIEDPEENAFDQDDEELFKLLAEQVVIAVQNARRVERRLEAERVEYLGLMAGGVAHRVGSKGGLIRLHVNKLRRLITDERNDVHTVIDKIERDNEYLIELSEMLFKPAEAAETPLTPVDVNRLLNQAARNVDISPDVDFSLELADDLPPVNGNRFLVDVFVELMENALRAMSESDEKRLYLRSRVIDKNNVAVICKDTGCGIESEEMSKLFEIFYTRGEREQTPSKGGYGLWYSKSIVTKMEGDLEIESKPGKGTRCTVLLQVASE
jgi:GAF domain-containing protein